MLHLSLSEPKRSAAPTPLVLSDRLITLAEEAERAGLRATATRLVRLACSVLEEGPAVRSEQPVLAGGAGRTGKGRACP